MRSNKLERYLILIGLPIILWEGYWYVGFNQNIAKLLHLVVSLLLLVFFAKKLFSEKKNFYTNFISYVVVFFIISILMAAFYWEQSPILTYRAGAAPLVVLYYFVLKRMRVTEKELIRIIFTFATIYTFLWLYAVSQAPRVVFGNLEEMQDDRGFYRILQLRSLDTVCLLFFTALVRYLSNAFKTKWLVVGVVSFIVIFLALSRMFIFSVLLVSVFFILRRKISLAFIIGILLTLGFEKLSQNEIVSNMTEMTNSQLQENEESNLRLTEYRNVFTAYPFHIGTTLFGNGAAHIQSDYGKYDDKLKWNMGFNRSDAGYVGIYTTYGLSMLILLFILLFHVYRVKVPMEYQPYRLFIFFLYIDNLTSFSFWGYGVSFTIALYALSLAENPQVKLTTQKK